MQTVFAVCCVKFVWLLWFALCISACSCGLEVKLYIMWMFGYLIKMSYVCYYDRDIDVCLKPPIISKMILNNELLYLFIFVCFA